MLAGARRACRPSAVARAASTRTYAAQSASRRTSRGRSGPAPAKTRQGWPTRGRRRRPTHASSPASSSVASGQAAFSWRSRTAVRMTLTSMRLPSNLEPQIFTCRVPSALNLTAINAPRAGTGLAGRRAWSRRTQIRGTCRVDACGTTRATSRSRLSHGSHAT